MDANNSQSLAERVERIRQYTRQGGELPEWSPEQWTNAALVKLGQGALCLASDQGPMTKGDRRQLDIEGREHLLACAAVCMDAVESLSGLDESALITLTLGKPGFNDKVLEEVVGAAQSLSLPISEALALLIGFGVRGATEAGLLGDRASEPMTRGELLREVMTMLEHEE